MKKRIPSILAVLIFSLFLTGCAVDGPDRIAYSSFNAEEPGRFIYSVPAEGGNVTRLARSIDADQLIRYWSDDGRFVYHEGEYFDSDDWLGIMNADGTGRSRILDISGMLIDYYTISPDGKTVLMDCGAAPRLAKPGGNRPEGMSIEMAIYRLDIESGELTKLEDTPGLKPVDIAWSPDGKQIAYMGKTANPYTQYDLYLMDADGSNNRKVTDHEAGYFYYPYLEWSPDGKKLLYSLYILTEHGEPCMDIFIFDLKTGETRNLTNSLKESDTEARWSPDGKTISFIAVGCTEDRSIGSVLYTMSADGSRKNPVSSNMTQVRWLPEGNRLLGVWRSGEREFVLATIGTDGEDLAIIETTGEEHGIPFYPVWIGGKN